MASPISSTTPRGSRSYAIRRRNASAGSVVSIGEVAVRFCNFPACSASFVASVDVPIEIVLAYVFYTDVIKIRLAGPKYVPNVSALYVLENVSK